jgi:hypothetical protein
MKAMAIVLVTMMAGCAPTAPPGSLQVQSASAETASFTPFRTFGFRLAEVPPSPYQVSARSFEVERLAHDMVAAELVRKGYADAGANADFLVRISSGAATRYASTVMSGSDEDRLQSVTTGEIVVDAFDRSTARQVWHGTARAEIDPRRIDEPELQAAVHQLLAPFPARTVQ